MNLIQNLPYHHHHLSTYIINEMIVALYVFNSILVVFILTSKFENYILALEATYLSKTY